MLVHVSPLLCTVPTSTVDIDNVLSPDTLQSAVASTELTLLHSTPRVPLHLFTSPPFHLSTSLPFSSNLSLYSLCSLPLPFPLPLRSSSPSSSHQIQYGFNQIHHLPSTLCFPPPPPPQPALSAPLTRHLRAPLLLRVPFFYTPKLLIPLWRGCDLFHLPSLQGILDTKNNKDYFPKKIEGRIR